MDVALALQEKEKAIQAHLASRRSIRERIAHVVLENPEAARAAALETLAHKRGAGVAWSKKQWMTILDKWSSRRIAALLTNPDPDLEVLADSHPFGGVLKLAPPMPPRNCPMGVEATGRASRNTA